MPRRHFTPEQIISKLREAEVLLSQGKTTMEVCRALNVSEQTYYRWRKESGGMGTEQAHRLKAIVPGHPKPGCWHQFRSQA